MFNLIQGGVCNSNNIVKRNDKHSTFITFNSLTDGTSETDNTID